MKALDDEDPIDVPKMMSFLKLRVGDIVSLGREGEKQKFRVVSKDTRGQHESLTEDGERSLEIVVTVVAV